MISEQRFGPQEVGLSSSQTFTGATSASPTIGNIPTSVDSQQWMKGRSSISQNFTGRGQHCSQSTNFATVISPPLSHSDLQKTLSSSSSSSHSSSKSSTPKHSFQPACSYPVFPPETRPPYYHLQQQQQRLNEQAKSVHAQQYFATQQELPDLTLLDNFGPAPQKNAASGVFNNNYSHNSGQLADLTDIELFDFDMNSNANFEKEEDKNSPFITDAMYRPNMNKTSAPCSLPPFSQFRYQKQSLLDNDSNDGDIYCEGYRHNSFNSYTSGSRSNSVSSMDVPEDEDDERRYVEMTNVSCSNEDVVIECLDSQLIKTEPIFETPFETSLFGNSQAYSMWDIKSPEHESDGYESSSIDGIPYNPYDQQLGVSQNLSGHAPSLQQYHPYRENGDVPIHYNPQYIGQSSPASDEGFVDITEDHLPDFEKLQQRPLVESEKNPQRRRSSTASPKERRQKTVRDSPSPSEKERRKPGRKPGQVSNVLHLWEFMRDLLQSSENRGIIEWISQAEGVFRVVNSTEVARLWGEKKKNKKKMTYEKLSRSLRYSRLEGYFSDLPKDKNYPKKLCFKFGPKSKDWH